MREYAHHLFLEGVNDAVVVGEDVEVDWSNLADSTRQPAETAGVSVDFDYIDF